MTHGTLRDWHQDPDAGGAWELRTDRGSAAVTPPAENEEALGWEWSVYNAHGRLMLHGFRPSRTDAFAAARRVLDRVPLPHR